MANPSPDVDPFAALANPVRRDILTRLRGGPCRAGDLARGLSRRFGVGRPAVSEHLQVLRRARLVREEPRGRERLYHLEPAPLRAVESWIATFTAFWTARLDALETLLDEDAPAAAKTAPNPRSHTKGPRHD